jgi:hypothetical protein
VTPSGKLVGSIAISLDDHPASPCWGAEAQSLYQEDIYVGYRYFETFCPQRLQFPFGFGLSYTSFTLQSARAETFGDLIKATVTVTNRGSASRAKKWCKSTSRRRRARSANRPKRWWLLPKLACCNRGKRNLNVIDPAGAFCSGR